MFSTRSWRPFVAALVTFLAMALAPSAHAGVFDVDQTFGTQGVASTPGAAGGWAALAVLPDGAFLAAGQTSGGALAVARFTAGGAVDPAFAPGSSIPGVATIDPVDTAAASSLIVLPSGQILVGATVIDATTSRPSMLVARLSADGQLDASFGTAGVATHGQDTRLTGLALDSTGRILASGYTTASSLNGVVERFSAAGVFDGSFDKTITLGNTTRLNAIAVDAQDRIVLTGTRIINGATQTQGLVVERLTAAGMPDPAFATAGVATPQLDGAPTSGFAVEGRRLLLDATGAVTVAATVRSTSGPAHLVGLARLTPAGALDPAFGAGGTRTQDASPSGVTDAADLTTLPSGAIAVVGSVAVGPTTQFGLAAYTPAGAPDGSANPANSARPNAANLAFGVGGSDRAAAVAVTPAGRLLVAGPSLGFHDAQDGVIVRLGGTAGAPQASFTTNYTPTAPGRKLRPGQTVSFDASASTSPNAAISGYAWDLDGNGTTDATGAHVERAYDGPGTYAVLLRVKNTDGFTGTTGANVDVTGDQAPSVAFSATDAQPTAGIAATFHVSGSDPDGTVASYAYDLDGDGSYETAGGSGDQVTTVFAKPGGITIGVRVTDDEGATSTATRSVTVKPAPCVISPQMKIGKASFVGENGDGCFHRVATDKGGVRTTTFTTTGLFHVNGIQLETPNGGEITITQKQKLTSGPKGLIAGDTTSLTLSAARAKVTGLSGSPFFFHTGGVNWDLSGDAIVGFAIDPSAELSGLPLKIKGGVTLKDDGTSSMDVLPGLPADLLGKTPSKFQTTVFGPVAALNRLGTEASRQALGAFSFQVDEIPLGVVTLGPVSITYDGAGGWTIAAVAQIPAPIAAKIEGKLVIVNGKVKSLDLHFTGHIPTPTPLQITQLGLNIDFGPKVAANPNCVKTVGLVDTTPYENYKLLDQIAPFLRPIAVAHPDLYGSLFRKTFINYPVPKFALCGEVEVGVGDLIKGGVKFGFAKYSAQYPDLMFFQGHVTLVDFIQAQISAEITTDGYLHFNAGVKGGYPNETDPWITWDLGFDFEYYQKKFNAQAWAKIGIPPINFNAGANLLVSSKGIAACLSLGTPFGTWRPGAGAKWHQSPTLYFSGCDVKDYKEIIKNALSGDVVIGDIVAKSAKASRLGADGVPVVSSVPETGHGNDAKLVRLGGQPASLATRMEVKAHAAQAAPKPVEIPKGLPGTVFTFKGADAPPHVILHSPSGEVFDTQSGNDPVQQPSFVAVKNDSEDITEVMLAKPAGGTWTIEVAADSSRLVQALQADGTTGASVDGKVRGSGQNQTLTYSVEDLPDGAHIDFVEAGKGGALVGTTSKSGTGSIDFHPAVGAAGPREVQAIVYDADGFISRRITMTTYQAPAPAVPKVAHGLKVKISGKKLVITWKADAVAKQQRLDFLSSEGINLSRTLKTSRTTMPLPAPGSKLKITVTGLGTGGTEGKPKTFTIKLPKAKVKKAKSKAKKNSQLH